MHLKMGKRVHLCEYEASELAEALNLIFERMVDVPRIRIGRRQTIETLSNVFTPHTPTHTKPDNDVGNTVLQFLSHKHYANC